MSEEAKSFSLQWTPAAAAAAVAFLIGCVWIFLYPSELRLVHDATNYYRLAFAAHENGVFSLFQRSNPSEMISDPLWPMVLSQWMKVFGTSVLSVQVLGVLLFALSASLFARAYTLMSGRLGSAWVGVLPAFSPVLSSFSPKGYSEPLVWLGGSIVLLSVSLGALSSKKEGGPSVRSLGLLALGALLIVITKAAFFPLVLLATFIAAWRTRFHAAITFAVVGLISLSSFLFVQSGGRGTLQLAAQAAKVELLSQSEIARCGVYNLSRTLGERLFPDQRGICALNYGGSGLENAERNYTPRAYALIDQGFSVRDYFASWLRDPTKHLLVALTSVTSMVFLEGIFPDALHWAPSQISLLFWILFTAGASVLLWVLFFVGLKRLSPEHFALTLCFVGYSIAFHANVPAEKRHFYPMLPFLYFSACLALGAMQTRPMSKS